MQRDTQIFDLIQKERERQTKGIELTQSRPLDLDIPVSPMPREIYDGSCDLTLWDVAIYNDIHSLILTIPFNHRTGKTVAIHLRVIMAAMTCRLVATHRPDHLVIEGEQLHGQPLMPWDGPNSTWSVNWLQVSCRCVPPMVHW